jgi:ketosteroid isomerase-like protein
MTAETSKARDEVEIRGMIEAWAAAIRAKDANGVVSHTSPESKGFFLAPPLQADAPLKKSLEEWFQTFRGPIGYEIHDLKITVGGDVAFCHSLNRIIGQRTDSEDTDIWVRETIGLRKIDGRWLITHEHESVPFYMDGSNRAAVDLKP